MHRVQASVIIRARDEARSIGRTLDLLAAQTVAHEVVVVDSGSSDGTQAIARARGAHLVEMPAGEFTFGGSLNVGVRAARAPDPAGSSLARATGGAPRAGRAHVVVALSAHAFPRSPEWLERMVSHFDDPAVACASGEAVDERFRPLRGPVRQDLARLEAWPFWGYSNGAGGFRASLWERRPFRQDLPGSEDREWSRWALGEGHVCVLDPALVVDHDHSRDPLPVCFERYRREHAGFAAFLDLPPYGVRDLAHEWWSDQGGHRSRARARLDPRRAARLAGKWRGRR